MAKSGLAAVEIGDRIGATAQEVNRLLVDQGFLSGAPGAYGLTAKGTVFGVEALKSSSNLPQARTWTATYWRDDILNELVVAPERLNAVRAALKGERLARSAARMAEQNAARVAEHAVQAAAVAKAAAAKVTTRNALVYTAGVVIALGIGYGVYKLTPSAKRVWQGRLSPIANTPESDEDEGGSGWRHLGRPQ